MFAMSAIAVSAAQSATDVTTSDRFSELVTFFLIALAIVAPSTLIVFRRMNRKGAGLRGEETTADPADAATGTTADTATGPEPDPAEVGSVIALIDLAAERLGPGESSNIEVPEPLLLDGKPAPQAIADALLADAVARHRLSATWAHRDGVRTVTLTR